MRVSGLEVVDLRFPTSHDLDGSDAMNPAPDYSATYVVLSTDDGLEGHGFTFTIGRGNEVCVAAVRALEPLVLGLDMDAVAADMAGTWRRLTGDSQLRWIGPEKGAIHLGAAAVVNALWDLYAKREGKPLWRLLVDMEPEELVACIDFRHLTDTLTPSDALAILRERQAGRAEREQRVLERGVPAYTTSAGWMGYPEGKLRALCRDAIAQGFDHLKLKVGRDVEEDRRRAAIVREEIGPGRTLMLDANQVWETETAISWMQQLAEFDPYWIEEPTHPDDILGHRAIADAVAPVAVATGEHCHNAVMFKQFLAAGAMGVCQIDACRLGGVNEVLAVLLLAAKHDVPVCPHAGGVGLCEYVQHLALFDQIAVAPSIEGRVIEYVDHLHEHFLDPVRVVDARYLPPRRPGYSAEMHRSSIERFRFPDGDAWRDVAAWRPPEFRPEVET